MVELKTARETVQNYEMMTLMSKLPHLGGLHLLEVAEDEGEHDGGRDREQVSVEHRAPHRVELDVLEQHLAVRHLEAQQEVPEQHHTKAPAPINNNKNPVGSGVAVYRRDRIANPGQQMKCKERKGLE